MKKRNIRAARSAANRAQQRREVAPMVGVLPEKGLIIQNPVSGEERELSQKGTHALGEILYKPATEVGASLVSEILGGDIDQLATASAFQATKDEGGHMTPTKFELLKSLMKKGYAQAWIESKDGKHTPLTLKDVDRTYEAFRNTYVRKHNYHAINLKMISREDRGELERGLKAYEDFGIALWSQGVEEPAVAIRAILKDQTKSPLEIDEQLRRVLAENGDRWAKQYESQLAGSRMDDFKAVIQTAQNWLKRQENIGGIATPKELSDVAKGKNLRFVTETPDEARMKLHKLIQNAPFLKLWFDQIKEFAAWEKKQEGKFVLEKNEISRLHKLIDALHEGKVTEEQSSGRDDKFYEAVDIEHAHVFVVKHDWASVLGTNVEQEEFHPPFDSTTYEYRISGKNVIVVVNGAEEKYRVQVFIEMPCGAWISRDPLTPDNPTGICSFAWAQTKAVGAVIEAEVATHEVVRAPIALNEKRIKNGKAPLKDFHVVDLSRRRSRVANPTEIHEPGGKKRLHFRRGHWRHYQSGLKVRIPWCLAGDPDLGFVNKLYKL